MDARSLVPRNSEYLAAEDLMDRGDVTLTITGAGFEDATFDQGRKERVGVVSFKEAKRRLVLNKTNRDAIVSLHGWETDEWAGKQVTLYATTTKFGSKRVPCIRVRAKGEKPAKRLSDV